MVHKILQLFLFISFSALAQDFGSEKLFSKEIGKNIKAYRLKSQQAHNEQDFGRAKALFDSLISNVVNNSYMDDFKVKKLSGRTIRFYDFKKPVFLITYASWCTPGVGEIPALNEIADKYHKEIDFIILFWDSKSKVRKATRDYSKRFTIVYVDEMENNQDHIVETMKHSLGFPTTFFIDENKKIMDVRRGVLHPYNEEFSVSYNLNYNAFSNGIALLKNIVLKKETSSFSEKKP
ncbi:TlpA family protein disulfide reductase [Ulvibacter sp.]|nr:TlpA family protein disulfide reductase [Ulvibacter sp.]